MKKKTIFILIMGITIGLVISGIGTYAATTYAVSSNKVSYTDNAKLGVDNVQAAIDGTCANISSIQDQIDSINNIEGGKDFGVSAPDKTLTTAETITLDSNSVYLLSVWIRAKYNLVTELGLHVYTSNNMLFQSDHAGAVNGDIYPSTSLTTIVSGTSLVSIQVIQRSGTTVSMDGQYRLIKLK